MDVRQSEPNVSEYALIVGRYSFQSYLRFFRSKGIRGTNMDERLLAQEWREIQQHVTDVEQAEKGVADNPQFVPLPDEMIPAAQEARLYEATQRAFGARSHQWWLVEIDRVVVFQPWVDLGFVREIQASIPKPVSHADHIRVAAGSYMTKPAVVASQLSEDRYVFTSRSTDVRFLGTELLDPACIQNHQSKGYATHVVAVFIGSGVNCLSAIHVDNRLILLNGTHRAYALRDMGFTHVACLVTHVTNSDERSRVLPASVKQDEARYLSESRPPLFKDYFDVSLRKIIPTSNASTLLRLKLEQAKDSIPTL